MKLATTLKMAALGALLALAPGTGVRAQVQGVTDNEIVLGTLLDLSGPINFWGLPVKNGMELAVDDINAAGGIHGRKLRLIVEDMAYDPKKAVLAAQKLVTGDRIFAMVGSMGTVTSAATMPLVLERGLPHLFPITPAEMFAIPFEKLKFAFFSPYYDDVRTSLKYLLREKGFNRIGVMYQDDEFGANVLQAVKDQLAETGLQPVSVTSYKRGATDFSSQIARLKADGADLVVLGTVVRETVGAMATARNLGWDVSFLISQAGYAPVVVQLGKDAVEGLYAGAMTPIPYADTASPEVLAWIDRYKAKFDAEPNVQAVVGYIIIETAAVGMQNAGPDLTPDTLAAGIERIMDYRNIFGTAPLSFSPTDHLGSRQTFLAQVRNGRWVPLTGFMHYSD
ncbi:MAG: ABC transporter substrate-binding protein [Rhodobacteraceae bacterium]|nr:ABC transporter substrate-binding protein [Paracoccaceae bacterium]